MENEEMKNRSFVEMPKKKHTNMAIKGEKDSKM